MRRKWESKDLHIQGKSQLEGGAASANGLRQKQQGGLWGWSRVVGRASERLGESGGGAGNGRHSRSWKSLAFTQNEMGSRWRILQRHDMTRFPLSCGEKAMEGQEWEQRDYCCNSLGRRQWWLAWCCSGGDEKGQILNPVVKGNSQGWLQGKTELPFFGRSWVSGWESRIQLWTCCAWHDCWTTMRSIEGIVVAQGSALDIWTGVEMWESSSYDGVWCHAVR